MQQWDEAQVTAEWETWQQESADPASLPALAPYHPLLNAIWQDKPLVIAQLGQSLDGRIATPSGHSHYINGSSALDHLHRLRALVDAVLVGAGTVAADNPQLSVRRVSGRSPARVVIDPSGRTGLDARWRDNPAEQRILIHRSDVTPDACPKDCSHIGIAADANGDLPIDAIRAALAERGLTRLLIEGGASTVSGWLDAGAIDHLHLLVGPLIIGAGPSGITSTRTIETLEQAIRPSVVSHYALPGGDMLIDCAL